MNFIKKVFGYDCVGAIYPGGCNEQCVNNLKELRIRYARTTKETYSFDVPENFLKWNPTCKFNNNNIWELIEKFIQSDEKRIRYFLFMVIL